MTGGADNGLLIGVTGHRDIDIADPELRHTVLAELERLAAEANGRPVVVYSCLAEGADRLVAELALDHLDAELVAPLPLPPAEYRRDFATASSLSEFARLLARARSAPVLDAPGAPLEGEARSRQYARAGAYIVERCQVLIALWDGEPARGPGGTGALVRWALEGAVPPELATAPDGDSPRAAVSSRRVVHIHPTTRRVAYLAAPGTSARSTSAS